MKAWLVTREWAGDCAAAEEKDRIVAVLNSRLSAERVREIVELLYVNATYSLSERLEYANGKQFNPYPAQFGWTTGEITCGHNPWLYGRRVDGIRIEQDEDGSERLSWSEIPRPVPKV